MIHLFQTLSIGFWHAEEHPNARKDAESGEEDFEHVDNATPLARNEDGKISLGSAHGTGPQLIMEECYCRPAHAAMSVPVLLAFANKTSNDDVRGCHKQATPEEKAQEASSSFKRLVLVPSCKFGWRSLLISFTSLASARMSNHSC
ncbi:hypothetical protein KCV07_g283, partial [Aureobasidium melanogenum]